METFDFITPVERRGTYSTQWDFVADRFGQADLLPFTISDMDFKAAPALIEAARSRVDHGVFGYSRWNHADYKNAIAHWFASRFNTAIATEMLAYSPSIIYSLARLLELHTQEGAGVIVQTPGYDAFFGALNGLKRKLLANPLRYGARGEAQIDFDHLERLAPQAQALILCSPHNPTGRVWSEAELQRLLEIAKRHNLLLLSDEAHMDIVFAPHRHTPLAKLWGSYAKAVLLASTAKGFNAASLGGSYLLFNDAALRQAFMDDLKARGLSSPPVLAIVALIAAYTQCAPWLEAALSAIEGNLRFIDGFIKENLPKMAFAMPQGCYFAWMNAGGFGLADTELQRKLVHIGRLAIMDGSVYRQTDPPYLRLNAACPLSKVEEAMRRMAKALA